MLLGYGLPLTFVPLTWAKVFGWTLPREKNLAEVLGRSLGIILIMVSVFAFLVPGNPGAMQFFFNFMLSILGGMTILHIYGALRNSQPKLETLEIVLWVILIVLTLLFYPI
jgi:hypothetical protein